MKEIHGIHTLPGGIRYGEDEILICKAAFKSSRRNPIQKIERYDPKTNTQNNDKHIIPKYGSAGLFLIGVFPFFE